MKPHTEWADSKCSQGWLAQQKHMYTLVPVQGDVFTVEQADNDLPACLPPMLQAAGLMLSPRDSEINLSLFLIPA